MPLWRNRIPCSSFLGCDGLAKGFNRARLRARDLPVLSLGSRRIDSVKRQFPMVGV
jgi:hypothetical protein